MITRRHRAAGNELAGIRVLSHLPSRLLRQVEALSTPLTFAPGRVLITEGSIGGEAFLIVKGTAAVVHRDGDQETTIAELGPGDVVGELALLDQVRRTATVVATSELSTRVMSRREFSSVLALPGVADSVRRLASDRTAA